jgi:hypothetical protein
LDTFSSKEDLLDVLCASCSFMPLNVRGTKCVDGLLTSFFPPLPPTATFDTLLKVTSFLPPLPPTATFDTLLKVTSFFPPLPPTATFDTLAAQDILIN